MTRRKLFYQQYPKIAARLTPEERGEDTERTIFNPQDCISLSMEYVRYVLFILYQRLLFCILLYRDVGRCSFSRNISKMYDETYNSFMGIEAILFYVCRLFNTYL